MGHYTRLLRGTTLCLLLLGPSTSLAAKRIPYGGVLRAAWQHEVKSFDPILEGNSAERQVAAMLFDRLIKHDPHGDWAPSLAAEWKANEDSTQWDFMLQKHARFHDGSPVTAAEVKSSFERLIRMTDQSIGQFLSRRIRGAEEYAQGQRQDIPGLVAKGPRQFSILTNTSQPALPEWLTLLSCSIVKTVAESPTGRSSPQSRKALVPLVGSGPFMVSSIDRTRVVLKPFAQYHAGPPFLERIEVSSRKTLRQPLALFRAGKLEMLEWTATDRIPGEREDLGLLLSVPRTATLLLGVNSQASHFKRSEAREAVARAIDRNIILRVLLKNDGLIASGIIPPDLGDYAPLREATGSPAEPALRLSSGEGAAGGENAVTIITRLTDETLQPIAQRIAVNLRDLGLRAQIEPLSSEEFAARLRGRKFDLFLHSFLMPSLDIGLNLNVFLAQYATFLNPERLAEVNGFLLKAESATHYDERAKQWYLAEKQILDEYTLIPIFHLKASVLAHTSIARLWVDFLGHIRFEDAWRKDER